MARNRKTKRPPAPPRFSRAWFVGWTRSLTLAAVMLFFFRTFLFRQFRHHVGIDERDTARG